MESILYPIVKMTQQRDLDSLEQSLVRTVSELISCETVSICKLVRHDPRRKFGESVALSPEFGFGSAQRASTHDEQLESHIEQCVKLKANVNANLSNGVHRLLLPFHGSDHEILGVVRIDSKVDLPDKQTILEAVVKIYENYLCIFYESERDTLTGLLNRRTFDGKLERMLNAQKNKQEELLSPEPLGEKRALKPDSYAWLAMLDIDHFKRINDTHGHLYGDEVLLRISQVMKECFRNNDLLFRFGGEEFVVVLEPVPYQSAIHALDRFRIVVASHDFPQIGQVTVSLGFERVLPNDFGPAILEKVDKALYYAKDHGRNCIYNYQELLDAGEMTEKVADSDIELF